MTCHNKKGLTFMVHSSSAKMKTRINITTCASIHKPCKVPSNNQTKRVRGSALFQRILGMKHWVLLLQNHLPVLQMQQTPNKDKNRHYDMDEYNRKQKEWDCVKSSCIRHGVTAQQHNLLVSCYQQRYTKNKSNQKRWRNWVDCKVIGYKVLTKTKGVRQCQV